MNSILEAKVTHHRMRSIKQLSQEREKSILAEEQKRKITNRTFKFDEKTKKNIL